MIPMFPDGMNITERFYWPNEFHKRGRKISGACRNYVRLWNVWGIISKPLSSGFNNKNICSMPLSAK